MRFATASLNLLREGSFRRDTSGWTALVIVEVLSDPYMSSDDLVCITGKGDNGIQNAPNSGSMRFAVEFWSTWN